MKRPPCNTRSISDWIKGALYRTEYSDGRCEVKKIIIRYKLSIGQSKASARTFERCFLVLSLPASVNIRYPCAELFSKYVIIMTLLNNLLNLDLQLHY